MTLWKSGHWFGHINTYLAVFGSPALEPRRVVETNQLPGTVLLKQSRKLYVERLSIICASSSVVRLEGTVKRHILYWMRPATWS